MTPAVDPRIDDFIASLPEWQAETCRRIRRLIHEAAPGIHETIKRRDRPYFVLHGNVAALQATKDHLNIFIYDPIAPDPEHIINQGNYNKTARSIQLYEHDELAEPAFQALIRAVVNNNSQGGWRVLRAQRK